MGLLDYLREQKDAALNDYKGLLGAYPNANKFMSGLLSNIEAVAPPDPRDQQASQQYAINRAFDIPGGMAGAINVWHGSPHKFDAFDMSKIGTGEGAQAYGHGLYFAENPSVANEYAQTLSNQQPSESMLFLGKKPLDINKIKDEEIRGQIKNIFDYVDDTQYPTDDLHNFMQDISRSAKDDLRFYDSTDEEYKQLLYRHKLADSLINYGRIDKELINEPQLYKTSLEWPDPAREAADPLGPQHFLDWDKPLSEQPESVRNSISELDWYKHAKNLNERIFGNPDDRAASQLVKMMADSDQESTNLLKAKGIPGIRYLDGGSRGAGEGSYNYVVFSDQIPRIVERNGKGLLNIK